MVEDARTTTRRVQEALARPSVPAEELLPLVYDQLRSLARARVARMGARDTVQATDLVHEAWLRLVGDADPGWNSRAHFFGAAARAMRNILVEQARRRSSLKRDAKRKQPLADEEPEIAAGVPAEEVLSLNDALTELEASHARAARVVSLRFFGGLTMPEVAEAVEVSLATAERDWKFARAWLQERIAFPVDD